MLLAREAFEAEIEGTLFTVEKDQETVFSMASRLPAPVTRPLLVAAIGNVRVDGFEGVVLLAVEYVLPFAPEAVFTQIDVTPGGHRKERQRK